MQYLVTGRRTLTVGKGNVPFLHSAAGRVRGSSSRILDCSATEHGGTSPGVPWARSGGRTDGNHGMTPKLTIRSMRFSEHDLRAWREGDYSLVQDCTEPLKRTLQERASQRPGRRFFGEAYVAAHVRHQEGWYGSFKWLTAEKWSGRQKLQDRYQNRFRDALMGYFPGLRAFQHLVTASVSVCNLGKRRPVAPDLWLTTIDRHRFIEVKLPGDRLGPHQLVGLALIAMFLSSDRSVSVEIVNLYQDKKSPWSDRLIHDFRAICTQLKELPGAVRLPSQ